MTLQSLVREIQNPALGAGVIWQFTVGYTEGSEDSAACPLLYGFIPLSLLFYRDTFEVVTRTFLSSGLRRVMDKLPPDVHVALQDRIFAQRKVSLESVRIAAATGLIAVDRPAASMRALRKTLPPLGDSYLRKILGSARKTGAWLGKLTDYEVRTILKVRF